MNVKREMLFSALGALIARLAEDEAMTDGPTRTLIREVRSQADAILGDKIPKGPTTNLEWEFSPHGEFDGRLVAASAMVENKEAYTLSWHKGYCVELFPSGDWALSHPWSIPGRRFSEKDRAPMWFKSLWPALAEAERMEREKTRWPNVVYQAVEVDGWKVLFVSQHGQVIEKRGWTIWVPAKGGESELRHPNGKPFRKHDNLEELRLYAEKLMSRPQKVVLTGEWTLDLQQLINGLKAQGYEVEWV